MPASPMFIRQVGHALAHLYDPDVLRAHPLIRAFKIGDQLNPHFILRNLLVDGIEALKPQSAVPIDSRSWRVYKVLHLRFVQKMDQRQSAYQLGIGVRHLRREQKASIGVLADSLADEYKLDEDNADHPLDENGLNEELFWLKSSEQEVTNEVSEFLSRALEVVEALATKLNVRLVTEASPALPPLAINPAVLRQVTISLISYAISSVPEGRVIFEADQQADQMNMQIRAKASSSIVFNSQDNQARLKFVRTILEKENLQLGVFESADSITLVVALPIVAFINVLMIDDNEDLCQLFKRYTSGTRYRISSIKSSQGLFKLVEKIKPELIILDVMIPGVDGWEVLGQLIHHPLTSALPVIVCTVLPERDLALALGATVYLPKPVTRSALLSTLSEVLSAGQQSLR
jgi:CheY-like chemotaxis protein